MKLIVLSMIIAMAFASAVLRAADPTPVMEWTGKKTALNGLSLTVWIAQEVPWDQMTTSWTITNTSDKELTRSYSGALQGFRLRMTTDESKELPMTDSAKRMLRDDTSSEVWKYSTKILKPGESFSVEFRMSELFIVTEPGRYKLTAQWEKDRLNLHGNLKLEVSGVPFAVGKLK